MKSFFESNNLLKNTFPNNLWMALVILLIRNQGFTQEHASELAPDSIPTPASSSRFQPLPPALLLDPQSLDSFGLRASSSNPKNTSPQNHILESRTPSLAEIATQLRLEGLEPSYEAIIDGRLVHLGSCLTILVTDQLIDLEIEEISEKGVSLGWGLSNEKYFLALPSSTSGAIYNIANSNPPDLVNPVDSPSVRKSPPKTPSN